MKKIAMLKFWFWNLCEAIRIKYCQVRKFKITGGRHYDFTPVICDECGWIGPVRWCFHTYEDDGSGEDVDPVDECPECYSREIYDLGDYKK